MNFNFFFVILLLGVASASTVNIILDSNFSGPFGYPQWTRVGNPARSVLTRPGVRIDSHAFANYPNGVSQYVAIPQGTLNATLVVIQFGVASCRVMVDALFLGNVTGNATTTYVLDPSWFDGTYRALTLQNMNSNNKAISLVSVALYVKTADPTTMKPTRTPTTSRPRTTHAPTTRFTKAPTTTQPKTTKAPTTPKPTTAQPTKAPTTAKPTKLPTTSKPITNAPTTTAPTTIVTTTFAPTTIVATTFAPTTVIATTNVPTTVLTVTDASTTIAATTAAPTTDVATTIIATSEPATTPLATTSAPTTSEITTSAPTTVAITTSAPTTPSPTTDVATTLVSTTNAPTTAAATTTELTTSAATTSAPTTEAATTNAPTTAVETTNSPTTQQTTAAPTTEAATTNAPTTVMETTSSPTTQQVTVAQTVQAPTTDAPTTSASTTEAITSSAPTTSSPTTAAQTSAAPTTTVQATVPSTSSAPRTTAPPDDDTTNDNPTLPPGQTMPPTNPPVSGCGVGSYNDSGCQPAYNVTSFGTGASGQLGVGLGYSPMPMVVPYFNGDSAARVEVDYQHAIIVTASNSLYVAGSNAYGQFGVGSTSGSSYFEQNPFFNDSMSKIVGFAGGIYHTVVLLENGQLYGFGSDKDGQLGLGGRKTPVLTPTLIPTSFSGSEKIIGVGCGNYDTLLWTATRAWALRKFNKAFGAQLIFTAPANDPIVSSADQSYSRFLILASGNVYAMGGNYYGNLGINGTWIPTKMVPVVPLYGIKVVKIANSYRHTLFMTMNDTVPGLYASGYGFCGQLGTGNSNSTDYPLRVTFFDDLYSATGEMIQGMAAGYSHSLVYTDKNLYVFGCNRDYNLGIPLSTSYPPNYPNLVPTINPYYTNSTIVDVASKSIFSFVITSTPQS